MPDNVQRLLDGPERLLPFVSLFAWAFAALTLVQLGRRILAGATVTQLFRDRFHECPPVRGLGWAAVVMLWVVLLTTAAGTIRAGFLAVQAYGTDRRADYRLILWTLGGLAALVALFRLRRGLQRLITEYQALPPAVAVHVKDVARGIPGSSLARLGAESFPNQIARTWKAGLWLRRVLAWLLGGAACYLATIYAWEWLQLHDRPGFQRWPVIQLRDLVTSLEPVTLFLSQLCAPLGLAVAGYVAAGLFLQFLPENRNYLLLRFPWHWTLLTGSGVVALGSVLGLLGPHAAVAVGGVLLVLLTRRLCQDLAHARRYQARQHVVSPMIEAVRRRCPFLNRLPMDTSCGYPPIDPAELARRITRGAGNLTEAGPLVTRHFGRYLRLASVRHEPCAVAMLRFLTVGRAAVLGHGWSTSKPLYYPQVPVWDLGRFPLAPPEGYQSANQRLELGSAWNAILTCGRCGGSGTVTETETYQEPETRYETEYSGGQSRSVTRTVYVTKTRTVTKTCPSCGGTGRLEHVQLLETYWRHLHCSATEPRFPMPELVEYAEEVAFFDQPYVEGLQPAPRDAWASSVSPALTSEMLAAGNTLADVSDRQVPDVLRLLGGQHLYRSGFAVHGFHTVAISFGRLFGRRGWFFGRRPEFHFPRLPLSWSLVATRIVWLPAVAWLTYESLRATLSVAFLP